MIKLIKRSFSALMALLLILSLLSGITFAADAATVNYQYGSTGKYSNVIKNWGIREEVATFLSPNAEAFYEDTTYEELIALDGSSNLTMVDTSALYIALNALMKNAHTKTNSYDDTKTLMAFTDIQNNGITSNKISAFYSGQEVGPDWDSGSTWNREHTWPNSKGGASSNDGGGVNEVDIMMIRPETASNNSSRGNKAYGESSGYYNPNLSDTYDVRGDAARTVLYVYVRWGTEESEVLNNLWGSDGVMESLDVMLTWMKEDPVDTWEMGRNDSVQSITGTRNVFVDYPELAFALFEEEIPQMTTPSGNAGSASYQITARSNNTSYGTVSLSGSVITANPASGYQVTGYQVTSGSATVIRNGNTFTVKASSDCTITITFAQATTYAVRVLENGILKSSQQVESGKSFTLPAFSGQLPEGYTFEGWSAVQVEQTSQKPAVYAAGTAVTITANSDFYAVLSCFDADAEVTDNAWTLVTQASQIPVGSQVIIAANAYDYAMSTTQNGNNRGQAAVTKSGSTLTYETAVAVFTLESGTKSGSYAFNTGNGYLFAVSASNNYLRTQASLDDKASFYIVPAADGTCTVTSAAFVSATAGVGNVPMQYNSQGMFACYPKATQKALSLYVAQSLGGGTNYTTSWESGTDACQHTDTSSVTVDATCTTDGSVTVSCNQCGAVLSVTAIAGGHREQEQVVEPTLSQQGYTALVCGRCGEELGREEYVAPLTDIEGWSLTLGSDLSVNFKINVDSSIYSTAKIHIAVAGYERVYSVSELTDLGADSYLASVRVAAVQMTDEIAVKVVNGTDETDTRSYSVKNYAQTVLNGDYPEATKELVTQMLYYGAAAQIYFGYRTNSLAAQLEGVNFAAPAAATAASYKGTAAGVTYAGATLLFRDRNAVRFYFETDSAITATADGETVTPVKCEDGYYVEIADINPQDLDQRYTVVVNGTLTVQYSPLNYLANMDKKGDSTVQTLVRALYAYYLAAEAYLA